MAHATPPQQAWNWKSGVVVFSLLPAETKKNPRPINLNPISPQASYEKEPESSNSGALSRRGRVLGPRAITSFWGSLEGFTKLRLKSGVYKS